MNTKTMAGAIFALFVVTTMIVTSYATPTYDPDMLIATSANSDGETLTMTTLANVKQVVENKDSTDDTVTFWAWQIPTEGPEFARVAAIAIHHGVNDHQAFGPGAKSSPVQSFHPHEVALDENFCVIGLESPKADFRVKGNTLTLENDALHLDVVTGTIGPRADCPNSPATLGVTSATFFGL